MWTGACGLSAAPGTALAKAGPLNQARVRQVGSLIRLVAGERIPIGGVGGVVWVDAGADPRVRGTSGAEGQAGAMVRAAQERLSGEGWRVATQEESMLVCRERSCARIGA